MSIKFNSQCIFQSGKHCLRGENKVKCKYPCPIGHKDVSKNKAEQNDLFLTSLELSPYYKGVGRLDGFIYTINVAGCYHGGSGVIAIIRMGWAMAMENNNERRGKHIHYGTQVDIDPDNQTSEEEEFRKYTLPHLEPISEKEFKELMLSHFEKATLIHNPKKFINGEEPYDALINHLKLHAKHGMIADESTVKELLSITLKIVTPKF